MATVSALQTTTFQSGASNTAIGNAMDVGSLSCAAIQISGTFVATVTFQGTTDQVNWNSLAAVNLATGAMATVATAPGTYLVSTAGSTQIRANVTSYTSGSLTAIGIGVTAASSFPIKSVGVSKAKLRNLAGTVTAVKSSAPTTLFGVSVVNTTGASAYIQLFDVATAGAVTLGTTTPDLQLLVPTASSQNFLFTEPGILFSNGLQAASTTAAEGNTGSAAGVYVYPFYF